MKNDFLIMWLTLLSSIFFISEISEAYHNISALLIKVQADEIQPELNKMLVYFGLLTTAIIVSILLSARARFHKQIMEQKIIAELAEKIPH